VNVEGPADRLRARLRDEAPVVAPGVVDAIGARLARQAGFATLYVSGAGTAAARGYPDMSILSLAELVETTRLVAEASGAEVVVDLDTGYGGLPTLYQAMRALRRAGAAGVHIEDQAFPRRCGYLLDGPCVPIAEMVRRLDAARAAGTDLVIAARTDALRGEGLDAAIERAAAYRDAGAELVFVNGISTLEELAAVAEALACPLLYNVSGSDLSFEPSTEVAKAHGVALVIYPIQAARAAAAAQRRLFAQLATGEGDRPELLGFREYMDLAGWSELERFERALAERPARPPAR